MKTQIFLVVNFVLLSSITVKGADASEYGRLMSQWVGSYNPCAHDDSQKHRINNPEPPKQIPGAALIEFAPEVITLRKMTAAICEFSAVYEFEEDPEKKSRMKNFANFHELRRRLAELEEILVQVLGSEKKDAEGNTYAGYLTAAYDERLSAFEDFFKQKDALSLPSCEPKLAQDLSTAVTEILLLISSSN